MCSSIVGLLERFGVSYVRGVMPPIILNSLMHLKRLIKEEGVNEQLVKLKLSFTFTMLWSTWKARNTTIFRNSKCALQKVMYEIQVLVFN